jgi:hypothetical protein
VHLNLATLIRECRSQVCFTGRETSIHFNRAIGLDGYLLKITRPQIESDVNYLHADVSSLNNQVLGKQDDYPAGDICCCKLNLKVRLSSYHWRGAAVACFASSLVQRRLREFAPPGQLNRSTNREPGQSASQHGG